jgi:hypothetical protein
MRWSPNTTGGSRFFVTAEYRVAALDGCDGWGRMPSMLPRRPRSHIQISATGSFPLSRRVRFAPRVTFGQCPRSPIGRRFAAAQRSLTAASYWICSCRLIHLRLCHGGSRGANAALRQPGHPARPTQALQQSAIKAAKLTPPFFGTVLTIDTDRPLVAVGRPASQASVDSARLLRG